MRTMRGLGILLLGVAGCVADAPAGVDRAAVVYGTDDRRDVYDHPDAALQARARDSIVALMPAGALDASDPADVRALGATLAEGYRLCGGERFGDQPTSAGCSGTLIDDDLVLTAGHCIADQSECEGLRFVFDYFYESAGSLATISRDDVYGCRRLVVRELLEDGSRDYAVVQLDRPATADGRVAVPVRLDDVAMGEGAQVTIIGFGSGIPAKIDSGGRVVSPRERLLDFFNATTDSFGGNSGSGVFAGTDGDLVGILVRGDEDYVEQGGCFVVNELPDSGETGGEAVTYVRRALDALCGGGWPSARLCGTAGSCGDGTCSGDETSASCASDCMAAACGDGVCDRDEDAVTCPADCEAAMMSGPPEGWTCPPGWYDAREGCDCGCGVRDPDCDVAGQRVFHCEEGQTCDASGVCVDGGGGGGWFCPAGYFGTSDGCDCECGDYDPDCDDPSQAVLNCPSGYGCGASGTCVDDFGAPPPEEGTVTCGTVPGSPVGVGVIALIIIVIAMLFLRYRRDRSRVRVRVPVRRRRR